MNKPPKYASLLLVLLFLTSLFATPKILAQTNLGIRLDLRDNDSFRLTDFKSLSSDLGIDYLEIMGEAPQALLSWAMEQEIKVYMHSGLQFMTAHRLADPDNFSQVEAIVQANTNKPGVTGFTILRRSATFKENVEGIISLYADSLRRISDKQLLIHSYYTESAHPPYDYLDRVIFEFRKSADIQSDSSLVYFDDYDYQPSDIVILNTALEKTPKLLILHYEWLTEAVKDHSDLKTAFASLKDSSNSLPEPKQEKKGPKANWNLLLLVLLWTTIVTHYAYHPEYRNNLFRYFFSHTYFTKEIMEYRIRNASNGFIILLQHSLFGGLFFYYLLRLAFSDSGIKAFFDNLPLVAIMGDTFLSVFILGILLLIIFQITAIIWISIFNREIRHLSQILTLYAWPLQLNFLVLTIMSTLFHASGQTKSFYVLAAIFVFIWFNAFNLAAVDTARYKQKGRILYAFSTIVLHFSITAAAVLFMLYNTPFYQVLQLSANLP